MHCEQKSVRSCIGRIQTYLVVFALLEREFLRELVVMVVFYPTDELGALLSVVVLRSLFIVTI